MKKILSLLTVIALSSLCYGITPLAPPTKPEALKKPSNYSDMEIFNNVYSSATNKLSVDIADSSVCVRGGYLDRVLQASATVTGGHLDSVLQASFTVTGGQIDSVKQASVTVQGGKLDYVYQASAAVTGGHLDFVKESSVTVQGGKLDYVYQASATITGGHLDSVLQGSFTITNMPPISVSVVLQASVAVTGGQIDRVEQGSVTVQGGHLDYVLQASFTVTGGQVDSVKQASVTVQGGKLDSVLQASATITNLPPVVDSRYANLYSTGTGGMFMFTNINDIKTITVAYPLTAVSLYTVGGTTPTLMTSTYSDGIDYILEGIPFERLFPKPAVNPVIRLELPYDCTVYYSITGVHP